MNGKGKDNNQDLSAILGMLLDGIIIVGQDGRIKYANVSASALFNKSTQDLIGQEFGYVIVPQKVQEIQIIQEQKILFVQMLASNIEWNKEQCSLISLRDVTENKKSELNLQFERQKLEQSNLELSQYASMASHDLREPVRKILTYSALLIDRYTGQLKAEPFKLIEKMHKSAGRLRSIIDGVSKFSNINKVEIDSVPVDLNQVIRQILDDIEILIIEKKVKIEVGNLPIVNGDSSLFYQLFLNLITNSIKYSKKDVSPSIDIHGKLINGVVTIIFSDNGIGFDSIYSKKIFEPFQRLITDGYDGTGIGLAICKKVVDAHQGQIRAESRVGTGTKFIIEIPQVRQHKII